MAFTVGGRYNVESELAIGGCGAYLPRLTVVLQLILCLGTVFVGSHTIAGKEVAIKIEPAVARNSPLKQESKIYKTLMGGTGVPWIMWSGKQGDFNVMIIDLLGPSLEDLFKMCNRHFTLKTVLLLTDQLVSPSLERDVYKALIDAPSIVIPNRIHPYSKLCPPRYKTRKLCYGHRQGLPPGERHRLWAREKVPR